MANVWNTIGVAEATLTRVGPIFDATVATDVGQTDINQAYSDGARAIMLGPGAVLTADLAISATTILWSPFHPRDLSISSTYKISVSANYVTLAGFGIGGGSTVGILVQGSASACIFERILCDGLTSHGLQFTTSGNDHSLSKVWATGNGGDGLKIHSGAGSIRATDCVFYGNTGYGVNDGDNSSILVANRIATNTAGNINGTPAVYSGLNKLT